MENVKYENLEKRMQKFQENWMDVKHGNVK